MSTVISLAVERIVLRAKYAAKAIVAAVTPIVATAATETIADLSQTVTVAIAAAVTGIGVFVARNAPKPTDTTFGP